MVSIYNPPKDAVVFETECGLDSQIYKPPVNLMQYDNGGVILAVKLIRNSQPYVLPTDISATARIGKPDGTSVINDVLGCNSNRDTIYISITRQITAAYGEGLLSIELSQGENVIGIGYINLHIRQNPVQDGDIASTDDVAALNRLVAPVIPVSGTGQAVAFDMVSPLIHNVQCRIGSTNLLDESKIRKEGKDYWTYGKTGLKLVLPYGKTFAIRTSMAVASISIYTVAERNKIVEVTGGKDLLVYTSVTDEPVYIGLYNTPSLDGVKVQLNSGFAQLPYTTYAPDAFASKVSVYGGNLFDINQKIGPDRNPEQVVFVEKPYIRVKGGTSSSYAGASTQKIPVVPGKYVFSVVVSAIGHRMGLQCFDSSGQIIEEEKITGKNWSYLAYYKGSYNATDEYTTGKHLSEFTIGDGVAYISVFFTRMGRGGGPYPDSLIRDLQISMLPIVDYCPYLPPVTLTAGPDGLVSGITSISPAMTIMTDNPGVSIEASCNADTKKYIDNKIDAISKAVLSMSGNV